MHESAFAGNETFNAAVTAGSEAIGGGVSVAAGAVTGDNEAGIDDGADEGDAVVGGLSADFVGMEGEVELVLEVTIYNSDVAHKLRFLRHWDNNEKVVDVAAIMFVTEIESNKAIELVKVNIGKELTGKIADDDTVAGATMKETFVIGKGGPISTGAADGDVFHRVVVDDLIPEKFGDLVEAVAVVGLAGDLIFGEITRRECTGIDAVLELMVKTPNDTLAQLLVTETDKITLNVKGDCEGGLSVIVGDFTDVFGEALLAIEDAFAFATRVRIGAETLIPPIGGETIEKMVDDAVAKRSSNDFAGNRVVDDKSNAATGAINPTENAIAQ